MSAKPSIETSEPQPGEVFREYIYQHDSFFQASVPEGVQHCPPLEKNVQTIDIGDLDKAVRAEVAVEYWGGHIGTSDQRIRFNGNEWIPIPQPVGTPDVPYCYYRVILGNPSAPVPLGDLCEGRNQVQFVTGPQVYKSFDWPFMWIYNFTVRVYYDPTKPHPDAQIVLPEPEQQITDMPRIGFTGLSGELRRLDFVGRYTDFDWAGDGKLSKWHYQMQYGRRARHIGTAHRAQESIVWDTSWLPDQAEPLAISVVVTAEDGVSAMLPQVDGLELARADRSVEMYVSSDVPRMFGANYWNQRPSCTIEISDDLQNATRARLALSTWSAAHVKSLTLNGHLLAERVGLIHQYSHDLLKVPLECLVQGANTFAVFNDEQNHAAEVNWPGPALLVEYAL